MPISNQVSIFVGGVQKSGTRSISQYFRQHPNLTVHRKNEGHFFDQHESFIDNNPLAPALNDYHNNFAINPDTIALCDITPDYIFRRASIQGCLTTIPGQLGLYCYAIQLTVPILRGTWK